MRRSPSPPTGVRIPCSARISSRPSPRPCATTGTCPASAIWTARPSPTARWPTASSGCTTSSPRAGSRRGDRIGLVGRNTANWGVTYLAAVTYGAVIVPILPDFTSRRDRAHRPPQRVHAAVRGRRHLRRPERGEDALGEGDLPPGGFLAVLEQRRRSCTEIVGRADTGYVEQLRRTPEPARAASSTASPTTTWPPSSTPRAPPVSPRASCSTTTR